MGPTSVAIPANTIQGCWVIEFFHINSIMWGWLATISNPKMEVCVQGIWVRCEKNLQWDRIWWCTHARAHMTCRHEVISVLIGNTMNGKQKNEIWIPTRIVCRKEALSGHPGQGNDNDYLHFNTLRGFYCSSINLLLGILFLCREDQNDIHNDDSGEYERLAYST